MVYVANKAVLEILKESKPQNNKKRMTKNNSFYSTS